MLQGSTLSQTMLTETTASNPDMLTGSLVNFGEYGTVHLSLTKIRFEFDRVFLDPSRRDYLEYRFGTMKSLNGRNGFILPFIIRIPYYVWLGCKKDRDPHVHKRLDAIATESPYLRPSTIGVEETQIQIHSKAYDQAIINLEANLPLPSFLYQQRLWRIPYDPKLKKHSQFTNYIYAFTWVYFM